MKRLLTIGIICAVLVLGSGYAFAGKYLVYDPGGSQDNIQAAMTQLGYTFDVRTSAAGNQVTSTDLTSGTYEALVIGWSVDGDYSGLAAVSSAGITGNAVLTGHDADYHTATGVLAAATVMKRMVDFAGNAAGTGILAFTEWTTSPFAYLPAEWAIKAVGETSGEIVTSITPAGTASGFYNGLTLGQLSNWGNSFHAYFTGYGAMFSPFEYGDFGGTDSVITIGTTVTPLVTPEPLTLLLLGCGLLGLLGLGKRD